MKPHVSRPVMFRTPKGFRTSFRFMLLSLLTLLMLVLCCLLTVVSHYSISNVIANSQMQNQDKADLVANSINWYMNELKRWETERGYSIYRIFTARIEHLPAYLHSQRVVHPSIQYLAWLSPTGTLVASAGSLPTELNNDHPKVMQATSGSSDPDIIEVRLQDRTMLVVKKDTFVNGQLQGTLVAYVDPQEMLEYLPLPEPTLGVDVLFDSQGQPAIWWGNRSVTPTQLADDSPLRQALSGEGVPVRNLTLRPGGDKFLGTANLIKSLGWVVFSGVSEKEVLSQLYMHIIEDFLLAVIISVLVLLITFTYTKRMAHSLHELELVALAVAKGDKNQRVHIKGSSELVATTTAFNYMLDRIQGLETDIYQLTTLSSNFVLIGDKDAKLRYANPAFQRFLGMSLEEMNNHGFLEQVHPEDHQATRLAANSFTQHNEQITSENRLRCFDGTYRWVRWDTVVSTKNNLLYSIGRDITEQKLAEQERATLLQQEQASRLAAEAAQHRFAFLAEASTIINQSLDHHVTLKNIARLLVPKFADWCEVILLDSNGSMQEVTLEYDPNTISKDAIDFLRDYPWQLNDTYGLGRTIRTGIPQFIPQITDSDLEEIARSKDHLKMLSTLNMGSLLCVPLTAHGNILGAITLVRSHGKPAFTQTDLQLTIELSYHSALALDNSWLYSETCKAEEQLRQQLEFNHAITDNMVEGLCVVDCTGRLLMVNPAAEQILGIKAANLIGHFLHHVLHGHLEHTHQPQCEFLSAFQSGISVSLQNITIERPDGTKILAEYSAAPIQVNGNFTGYVFVFQDITARKAAETALRKAEEERDLSRMRFLQIAAHELRNPMASVKGMLSLLRRRHASGKSLDSSVSLFDVMEHEIDRLSALLNEILDSFRVQAGQLKYEMGTVDLTQVIRTALKPFDIGDEHSRFILEGLDTAPILVNGDSNRLEEVFRNLISNARKYSPQHSSITIRLQSQGEFVNVAVADCGVGIPQDQLHRVFEEFFRANNLVGCDPGGIGLGLYICRDIIQRHGGKIWVESKEGIGTTFFVELPLINQN